MEGTERRDGERPGRVLGTTLALGVLLAAVALLVGRSTEPLDGAALVAEHFEVEELPFAFEVVDARRLALGERVVVLADPDGWRALELPLEPVQADAEQGREGPPQGGDGRRMGGGLQPGDPGWKPGPWAGIELGEEGAPPREAALVWYPLSRADDVLERQFQRVQFQDVAMLGWEGGSTPVDSGYLDWQGYRAGFVHVRTFERRGGEPTFRDHLRVNLSVAGECCVLYLAWPRGQRGSRVAVEELVTALVPRAAAG